MKSSVLEGVNTPNQLIKLELRKEKNLMMVKEVDIGFGACRALHDKSGVGPLETKLAVEFRSDCVKILQKMGEKILGTLTSEISSHQVRKLVKSFTDME